MVTYRVVTIAAGLLLTVSGPSFAGKLTIQMSGAKEAPQSQSRAIKSRSIAVQPQNHDPYSDSREADPYAFGVNWPKAS